jgi:hypothetical protein
LCEVLVQVKLERNLGVASNALVEASNLGSVKVEDQQLDLVSVAARDARVGALEDRVRKLYPESDLKTVDGNVILAS